MNIYFNTNYYLKPNKDNVLIMAAQLGRENLLPVADGFETRIHPIHAMILSFVDGRDETEIIDEASLTLKIDSELIRRFLNRLIDNDSYISIKTSTGPSIFPPKIVISGNKEQYNNSKHRWQDFIYGSVDLSVRRHFTPSSLTLMVNNVCHTQCYYCYADKRSRTFCSLPYPQVQSLIKEARELHVRSFDVIGGEFFLYPHWENMLKDLHNAGYHPYISTKMPLNEKQVAKLVELGVHDIQISLDSLIATHLERSLKVSSNYVGKIKKTLELLDKKGISVYVHSVLSKETETIGDLKSVYQFISSCANIAEWKIDKAGKSLYASTPYSKIEVGEPELTKLVGYLDEIKDEAYFPIRYPRPDVANQIQNINPSVDFLNRGLCSGNYSSLFILPDGKVTICEELYWNKKFIIGDIKESTIREIWNSESALDLFNLKQGSIPSDSKCRECSIYSKCRSVRQVCYKEIIKKYGENKWYYPDVNCPF